MLMENGLVRSGEGENCTLKCLKVKAMEEVKSGHCRVAVIHPVHLKA
jgi:hypothetical protein